MKHCGHEFMLSQDKKNTCNRKLGRYLTTKHVAMTQYVQYYIKYTCRFCPRDLPVYRAPVYREHVAATCSNYQTPAIIETQI